MGRLSQIEDDWQRKATETAVAEARKVALGSDLKLAMIPIGRLSDQAWAWVIAAAIFGWIRTRCEQAISEGVNPEELVRTMTPAPDLAAAVRSILPVLADKAGIDWSKPLASWSQDEMTGFLQLSWSLISEAKEALGRGPGVIVQAPANKEVVADGGFVSDDVPFDL